MQRETGRGDEKSGISIRPGDRKSSGGVMKSLPKQVLVEDPL